MQEFQKHKQGYKVVKSLFGKYEEIPENWEILPLSILCNIRQSNNISSNLYIGLEHIAQADNILVSTGVAKDFISHKNVFHKGDILYGKLRPLLNKVYLTTEDGYCSTDILPLIPSERIQSEILLRILVSQKFMWFAVSTSAGTKMPRTNWQDIKNFKAFVPPLKEQQKISSILSHIDELIQKTDQVIEQTQRFKKGLMQSLLTRGIGHTKFKKIKQIFGEEIKIPEEWFMVSLDDVCNNITDGKHGDCQNERASGYYFISAKDIFDGEIHYENAREITKHDFLDANKRTKLEPGDILLTNSGTIGKLAIVKNYPKTTKTTFQKSVAILKPIMDKVAVEYLYNCLLQNQERLENVSAGSSQKNLLLTTIKSFDIPIPNTLDEQEKIGKILSYADNQSQSEKTYKSYLTQLKIGLMQNLLTGKIRVKV